MFGKSVSRIFGGVIGNWTMRRWFSMLVGLLFFAVSTFGVVEKSLAITAGVTCPAATDVHAIDSNYRNIQLFTSPSCSAFYSGGGAPNSTNSNLPIAILFNTNHDGTPTMFVGFRIDYHGATISNMFVDGASFASETVVTATTANAFSHTVQYDYAGNTYNFVLNKDAGTDTLKAFTVVLVSPVITGGDTAAVNAAENQTAVTDVQSTDAGGDTEGGGGLTYAKTGGADQAMFNIDANTGVLTFITAPDFETLSDGGANNVYDVQVTVTNSGGFTDVQDIAVTVTNVTDAPPVISSDGGNATANVDATENVTAVTTVTTTPGDGGAVTYSISGGADQALFSIDTNSGALTFNTAEDFENPTNANNQYVVQVTATDGSAQADVQTITVSVADAADVLPVITSDGGNAATSINVVENSTSVTTLIATQGDGGAVTFSISGGADQALFSINANSGALAFKNAEDFETPTNANNQYVVKVTATDGSAQTDVQTITVSVTDSDEINSNVEITGVPAITNGSTPFTATFTFNEGVNGFDLADINAALGNATASGFKTVTAKRVFTALITPNGDGNVVVGVKAGAGKDDADNDNLAANDQIAVLDNISPTVEITGTPLLSDGVTPFDVTVQFSENVTGFVQADIEVGNGSASGFVVVDANTYTATITPNGNGDVVVGVNAGTSKDDAGNDNLAAANQTAILDNVSPTVEITAPTSTDGLTAFSITVQFSETVTGLVQADITVGNGAASGFVAVDGDTYTAIITPTGKGDVTIDVAANVAVDAVSNGNTAAEQVTVKSTIVEDTQKVIATFMHNRAYHILSNQPKIGGLLNGSSLGGGGPLGNLDVDGNEGNLRLSFSSSLSRLRQKQKSKADKRIDGAFPVDSASSTYGEAHNFDIWTEVYGSASRAGNADSDLWVGYLGAHYFVSPDMIIGALVQVDWASETNKTANTFAEGTGWMVGPYIAGRIGGTKISYEARVAWGRSENDVTPNGNYTDQFETERFLASAKLSGSYKLSAWTIAPQAGISWFEEDQEVYSDSLGNLIPQQTVSLGEYSFGPSFTYDIKLEDGTLLQPSFGISGVQNFGIKKGILTQGTVLGSDDLRAKLDAGIAITNTFGWSLAFTGFYDGVGLHDYDAYGGSARLVIPLN